MKRESRIEILLTDAERAVVANAATKSGLTLSSYVRMAMMLAETDPAAI